MERTRRVSFYREVRAAGEGSEMFQQRGRAPELRRLIESSVTEARSTCRSHSRSEDRRALAKLACPICAHATQAARIRRTATSLTVRPQKYATVFRGFPHFRVRGGGGLK